MDCTCIENQGYCSGDSCTCYSFFEGSLTFFSSKAIQGEDCSVLWKNKYGEWEKYFQSYRGFVLAVCSILLIYALIQLFRGCRRLKPH